MPLYKSKGGPSDPDDYRGIALLSSLSKLFTACLSNRISHYMYGDGKIGFEQAGFKPEFTTMDHVFTLHEIIEYYKYKRSVLLLTTAKLLTLSIEHHYGRKWSKIV